MPPIHEDDFGMSAEWHCVATSHGKSSGKQIWQVQNQTWDTKTKPVLKVTMEVRGFSFSTTERCEKVMKISRRVKEHATSEPAPSLSGYVTACYDGYCWLGCIIQSNVMTQSVTVNVLHHHLPAMSYVLPEPHGY